MDIQEIADLGKQKNIITIIDSTFATPVNQKPLEFGVDLVIHATTKYIGGHNDIIGGVLAGSKEYVQPIAETLRLLGGISDPNTAFLLERGIKTLAIRMKQHNDSAQKVAEFLEGHSKVEKVYYPGLSSHPCHSLAKEQMQGFGGVVSFIIKTDFDGTLQFVDRLNIPYLAPSFGGPESLVDPMALMSFWETPKKEREKVGIFDNLVRYSLGLEDPDDIIGDLKRALDKI
jgi:cystathionine gamma-synthase